MVRAARHCAQFGCARLAPLLGLREAGSTCVQKGVATVGLTRRRGGGRLAATPRCVYWAEAQARRELEEQRVRKVEEVEMSQERFLRVCAMWGRVVRAKCALLPRMVRMAMMRVRKMATDNSVSVQRLAKGFLARRRVRRMRREMTARGHAKATVIQAAFRGFTARWRVAFRMRLVHTQVANAKLFEAQEAFVNMDEVGPLGPLVQAPPFWSCDSCP
jgi:hypothetical protein